MKEKVSSFLVRLSEKDLSRLEWLRVERECVSKIDVIRQLIREAYDKLPQQIVVKEIPEVDA